MPLQVMGFSEEADLIAESKPNAARQTVPDKHYRTVVCFDCQHVHRVSGMSTSSLCPNCGSYIDLRDVVIKDRTTQKIRTRGDVVVEKKGALLGTSITCGNLTVEGQVAGSIYASGTVTFRASGKVLGEVRCQHLLVEKKCEVQFLQPIHAETLEIYGDVSGRFTLTGRAFLNRRGTINGSLQAQSMLMESGAKLNGGIHILPKPLPLPAPVVAELPITAIEEKTIAPNEGESVIPEKVESLNESDSPPPEVAPVTPVVPEAVAAESLAFWAAEMDENPSQKS
jgi:cytoskeletal protein CcmA (bactofilin family)/predicted RNA-binding Zn-ribbon protein involved in translation (DUF1610 family)